MKMRFAGAALLLASCVTPLLAADRPYRSAALDAARWIRSAAVQTGHGIAWPADPRDPTSTSPILYSGNAGIVVFFLEAYAATQDVSYLHDATAGADYLLAKLPSEKENGLYAGIAGMGFALTETFKATRDEKYRRGALDCLQELQERAVRVGDGVQWSDTADIISGSAGTGLFLLYAARELQAPQARELAVRAGTRLIELRRAEGDGTKWAMSSTFPRLMPNFAHGTAGIAYFLATLYRETRQQEFLDAALAGARYLQGIAYTQGDVCLIFHDEPDNKKLYYLGWCHGPAGTARLFYRLYEITGNSEWMDWVARAARADIKSGIPEKQTPGFWNNISQCCGSAAVAEFTLNLYRVTGKPQYLRFSKHVTADLLTRATRDERGLRWVQAENRTSPHMRIAQTGYMQGAAGVGALLLHLDAVEHGRNSHIVFPDSPF